MKGLEKMLKLVVAAAIVIATLAGAGHDSVPAPKPSIECQVRSL